MSNELLLSNYDIHELVAQHERTGDRRNAAFFVACEVRDRYEAQRAAYPDRNDPLLTDDDIDEIASGYTGTPRDVGIFTGIEVRNHYETALNNLRAEMSDMVAKLYGANEQLRAEVRSLHTRLAQLEAEAERNRGDHK